MNCGGSISFQLDYVPQSATLNSRPSKAVMQSSNHSLNFPQGVFDLMLMKALKQDDYCLIIEAGLIEYISGG